MFEYIFFMLLFISFLFPIVHVINALKVERKCTIDLYRKNIIHYGFSILIPCYNEEKMLATTLQGILELEYPNFEVIFINDGSTDHSFSEMHRLLGLTKAIDSDRTGQIYSKKVKGLYKSSKYPNIYLLDKENGGKADSINAAINVSSKELVVTLDADSILDRHALTIVNTEFQDPELIAAGGTVKILQSKKGEDFKIFFGLPYIIQAQALEYLRGFYIYKRSLSKFRALAIISGAFGIFRKSVLFKIDGFRDTIGEDIDITIRIQKLINESPSLKIKHIPESVCFTECPEKLSDLRKQRIRWQKAFVDSLIAHRGFFLKNLFKTPLSFFFIFDAFLFGTVSVFVTYLSMLGLFVLYDFQIFFILKIFAIYYSLTVIIQLIYTISSVHVSKKYGINIVNRFQFVKTVIFDIFFFRFVTMLYIIAGSIMYFFGKHGWNKVERTGRVYFEDDGVRKGTAEV